MRQSERRRVVDRPQAKTVRHGGGRIGPAIPTVQQFTHDRRGSHATTHLDQQTRDVADHVMQEGVGGDIDVDELAVALHPQRLEPADRRSRLALCSAERAEVVLTDEAGTTRLHRRDIERRLHPGHTPSQQRGARAAVVDRVPVVAALRGEPGMEKISHGTGPNDAGLSSEAGVDTEHPSARTADGGGIEMDHLTERVHAGVRTPSAAQIDRMVSDMADRLGQLTLDGAPTGLLLPAAIVGAVVLHAERPSLGGYRRAGHDGTSVQGVEQSTRILALRLIATDKHLLELDPRCGRIAHLDEGAREI